MLGIIKKSFIQLMLIYFFLIFLASFGFIYRYVLHFELFALILGIFGAIGILSVKTENRKGKWLAALVIASLVIILVFRIIPYLSNAIPLGYDPGIYKYGLEFYKSFLPNIPLEELPLWLKGWAPPGFFSLTNLFYLTGLTTDAILIPLFILLEVILGLMIYATAKSFFGKKAAVFSLFLYSISVIQFTVFGFLYFKNVIALILLLASLYLLNRRKFVALVVVASFLAGVHRPTFLLFALTFAAYYLLNLRQWRQNTLIAAGIALLSSVFYIGRFNELILNVLIPSIAVPSPGTFINFFTYQFLILLYLPFALVAFFYLLRKREFNLVFLGTLIAFLIVFFKIVFFNRFIIFLELFVLILAGFGLKKFLEADYSKWAKGVIVMMLIVSSIWLMAGESINAKPLVNETELNSIKMVGEATEENALVMCTDNYYSVWLQGYADRRIIAPGLFDLDRWDRNQWQTFWETSDLSTVREMLSVYDKPLYIFVGKKSMGNRDKFENNCFEKNELDEQGTILYKYLCD